MKSILPTFLTFSLCIVSCSKNNSTSPSVDASSSIEGSSSSTSQLQAQVQKDLEGYKIAFGNEQNIYMMNPNGSQVEKLASHSRSGYIAWGFKAEYIYYAAIHPGAAWEAFRVHTKTKKVTRLSHFNQDVRSLGVSPDGKHLAISLMSGNSTVGNNNDNLTQFHTNLYLVPMEKVESLIKSNKYLSKADLKVLVESEAKEQFWYEELNWNPKLEIGKSPTLAYTKTFRYDDDANSYTDTYTINADGSQQTLIQKKQDQPIWDFTGTKIGFLSTSYYDTKDKKVHKLQIQNINQEISTPAISPDGKYVFFEIGDRPRHGGLALFSDDPTPGVQIGTTEVYEPRWSPVKLP